MGAYSYKIQIGKAKNEVFESSLATLSKIGKVVNINYQDSKVVGKMKFGLQTVIIKIHFDDVAVDTTQINFIAWSDDIWSYGAKNCIKRFIKFYEEPERSIEQKDLLGISPLIVALISIAFYWLIKNLVLVSIESDLIWDYLIVLGIVVTIHLVISRIKFNDL